MRHPDAGFVPLHTLRGEFLTFSHPDFTRYLEEKPAPEGETAGEALAREVRQRRREWMQADADRVLLDAVYAGHLPLHLWKKGDGDKMRGQVEPSDLPPRDGFFPARILVGEEPFLFPAEKLARWKDCILHVKRTDYEAWLATLAPPQEGYWSLAQVLAWACFRDEKRLKQTGNATDKAKELDTIAKAAGLMDTMDGFDSGYEELLCLWGGLSAYGRETESAPLEAIPKDHWRHLRLRMSSLNTNRSFRETPDDFVERQAAPHEGVKNLEQESIEELYERAQTRASGTASLPEWRDLSFDPAAVKKLFAPCREDEPLWDLRETVGFIGLGYPLPVAFGYQDAGKKKVAEIEEEVRKAIQRGDLTVHGRGYFNEKAPFVEIPKSHFYTEEIQFCLVLGSVSTHGTEALKLRFESAQVRRLWGTTKPQARKVMATTGSMQCKTYPPQQLEKHYKAYVQECLKSGRKPTREADRDAMKSQFPEIGREAVRDLRRSFAPADWQGKGRRKTVS